MDRTTACRAGMGAGCLGNRREARLSRRSVPGCVVLVIKNGAGDMRLGIVRPQTIIFDLGSVAVTFVGKGITGGDDNTLRH